MTKHEHPAGGVAPSVFRADVERLAGRTPSGETSERRAAHQDAEAVFLADVFPATVEQVARQSDA